MDAQQPQDRDEDPDAHQRATRRTRAADARLRRAIREAFARQRAPLADPSDGGDAKRPLHVVRDAPALIADERTPDRPQG
jgi:hypothetical protein